MYWSCRGLLQRCLDRGCHDARFCDLRTLTIQILLLTRLHSNINTNQVVKTGKNCGLMWSNSHRQHFCYSLFKNAICLYLLVRIVYILYLTIFKQWNLLMYMKIWETAKCSYPYMLEHYQKWNFLKMCGPQIRLCLFTIRPIALKQLNILTTIDTFS